MQGQGWRGAGGSSGSPARSNHDNGGYDVQSTYMPSEDPYARQRTENDNPFGLYDLSEPGNSPAFPQAENPFVGSVAGATPAMHSGGTASIRVSPAAAQGDSSLVFHNSELPTHSVQGKMGSGAAPSSSNPPKVQPFGNPGGLLAAIRTGGAGGEGGGPDKPPGFFSIARYSGYFNVDTQDVLMRMLDSVIGGVKPNFLESIGERGDLYGPFWIATTLVALSGVIGNHEITKVGASAALFYGYVGVFGVVLWALLKWMFKVPDVGLTKVWCTYGYALSIFIPVALVCVIRIELMRWIVIGVATLTSGLFLMMNFRRPIFDSAGAKALPVWLAVGALHLGLGLALKLYFFRYTTASIV
ncbi:hypothetical protein WJX73_002215 [Symbiochloris irregularis]|uniref:Protein YIP n=1 Tax=Symbiochloris irregularis TaxID=706552 RepID=A0AAW1NR75_9CHLO